MKLPYRKLPPPVEQVMAHDHQRFVVQLNQVGLAQLQRFPSNPGIVAFATGIGGGKVVAEDLMEVKGDLIQVGTSGIHHDWIWEVKDGVRYVVLVWPFHAPMSWQIVGYRMSEDITELPIPWSAFQSFERQQSDGFYGKEIGPSDERLQETNHN